MLERLDMTCFTSLLLNPFLSVEELLREILLDFGVVSREAVRSGRIAAATKHDLVSTLHEFLVSLIPIGGSGVLIIDEAQHLSPQVLEELRVLSNLETNHSKLLQIVLVGQLNLLDVLASPAVKQLDQRISMRATLNPLTRPDVESVRRSSAVGGARLVVDYVRSRRARRDLHVEPGRSARHQPAVRSGADDRRRLRPARHSGRRCVRSRGRAGPARHARESECVEGPCLAVGRHDRRRHRTHYGPAALRTAVKSVLI